MSRSVAGSNGSNQWKRLSRPSSRSGICGSCNWSGGSDQPPAELKPQDLTRAVVSSTQAASDGAKAVQLYQMRSSATRSGAPPSSTLTPAEKNRSPQGVTSQAAPWSRVTAQRLVGAWSRSQAADWARAGAPATARPRPHAAARYESRLIIVMCPLGRRCEFGSSGRAADGQPIHAQRRLADADRDTLAVLTAGADAVVELQVVADHGDLMQRVRAAADQGGTLDRGADPAVLDQVGLGCGEHELAVGDVNLAAAEIDGVEAALHRLDDLVRRMVAAQHQRVGHARHRMMGIALAPAVAGRRHAHQAGIQAVLHVSDQNAVLDQRGAARRRALVVDRERAAPVRDGAVVDHGHAGCCDALADPVREGRQALAVEIALEPVADRLVQHDAGPAGTQHHGHFARRGRDRAEIDERGPERLVDLAAPLRRIEVEIIGGASASAGRASLHAVAVADH